VSWSSCLAVVRLARPLSFCCSAAARVGALARGDTDSEAELARWESAMYEGEPGMPRLCTTRYGVTARSRQLFRASSVPLKLDDICHAPVMKRRPTVRGYSEPKLRSSSCPSFFDDCPGSWKISIGRSLL